MIEELGYQSSLVAQSLRSRSTNVIGVLVVDIEPFSAELLKGVARAIHDTGYELVVFSGCGRANDQVGWERRYLQRVSGTLCDGAILVTPSSVDVTYGAPVVAVDHNVASSSLPTVDSDNLSGAVLATEYLLELGHRRIGFLAGRPDLESARLRERGYRTALKKAGIKIDSSLIRIGGYQVDTAEEAARQMLEPDDRPTAIFAANDVSALATISVAGSLGLAVPEDLSVIGFDNVPESALSEPPLTTIEQPIQQMGFDATEILIRLIGGATRPGAHDAADQARRSRLVPATRGRTMTVTSVESAEPLYRDASRPRDERVEDLLRRMTREEKVGQLGSAWVFQLADGAEFSTERAAELLRNGLGHVTRISGASSLEAEASARLANAIQSHLVEETRLGIPAIVHEEICSGLMAREATVFPQAIGLASTWDPDLAEALADSIRVQMRAIGAHQGLAPVLDVCRDPRWGRTEETFGEDPYLVSRFGVAFVRGLQGASLRSGVIATVKHFVGYGASDGGMNWAPAGIPPRELREVYLHPFEAAVRTGGTRSLMNAYNEIDGVLCAVDRESAHLDPEGRVGLRRVRRLRLLLHPPDCGLPPACRRRGGQRLRWR